MSAGDQSCAHRAGFADRVEPLALALLLGASLQAGFCLASPIPLPDSPWIITGAMLLASRRMIPRNCRMAGASPVRRASAGRSDASTSPAAPALESTDSKGAQSGLAWASWYA